MYYNSGSDRWLGSFTPGSGSGRNDITVAWETDRGSGNYHGGQKWSGSFGTANAAYASNTNSGPAQYLTATDTATGLEAGSINKGPGRSSFTSPRSASCRRFSTL